MNRERVKHVIVELFSSDGDLGYYRKQYSEKVFEDFCSDRLSERIICKLKEQFERHVSTLSVDSNQKRLSDELMTDCVSVTSANASTSNEPSEFVNLDLGNLSADGLMLVPLNDAGRPEASQSEGTKNAVQSSPISKSGGAMPRKFSFRLTGGKLQVGVPYDGRIESVDGAPNAIAHILSVHIPAGIGLEVDKSDPAHLTGIPASSGEVTFDLNYRIEANGSDQLMLSSNVTVFVNHDPKTLWKDLPSDQSDPYWKSDTDAASLLINDRRLIVASKRGRSHAHEGKFRDDDFRIVRSEASGWVLVAVADGAGSAAKSRLGSKIAVNKSVDILLEKLDGPEGIKLEELVANWKRGEISREVVLSAGLYPILGSAAFEACKALESEALNLGVHTKEFSTTLLVTAYKNTSLGHVFVTYWVGDGGVGIYLKDGSVQLLGKVDSGEFAGQTRFLDSKVMTTEEIANRLNFAVVDDFRALIAMTDGITDPYFTTDNNLESGEYWERLWAEIEPALNTDNPANELLGWLDFWSPGNHDDRTIAVLW